MYSLTDKQIKKAVLWWANQIVSPKFDAGADSVEMIFAETMASQLVQPMNSSNKERFKEELRKALSSDEYNPHWGLHVDYHPDKILSDSAEIAGISENNFPWKTSMYFDADGSVSVKCGYGAKIESI